MESQDIQYIKDALAELSEKQELMSGQLSNINHSLTRLNQTVIGNKEYGQKGLVSEVESLRNYVDKDKIRNSKIMGGLAVIGVLWTFLLKYFLGNK